MPSQEIILERLLSKEGLPYVWGGNYSQKLERWESLYPPPKSLSQVALAHWSFQGLDCSGLLYEATEGLTPRNTSGLFRYGEKVQKEELRALDLALYPGHVMIILNKESLIESSLEKGGVVISPIEQRLNEIKDQVTFRRFL